MIPLVQYSPKHNMLMHKEGEMVAALPSESVDKLFAQQTVFIVSPITCFNQRILDDRLNVAQEGRLILVVSDPKTKMISGLKIHHSVLSRCTNSDIAGIVITYLPKMPSANEVQTRPDCKILTNLNNRIKLIPLSDDEYKRVFKSFSDFVCSTIKALKEVQADKSVKP